MDTPILTWSTNIGRMVPIKDLPFDELQRQADNLTHRVAGAPPLNDEEKAVLAEWASRRKA